MHQIRRRPQSGAHSPRSLAPRHHQHVLDHHKADLLCRCTTASLDPTMWPSLSLRDERVDPTGAGPWCGSSLPTCSTTYVSLAFKLLLFPLASFLALHQVGLRLILSLPLTYVRALFHPPSSPPDPNCEHRRCSYHVSPPRQSGRAPPPPCCRPRPLLWGTPSPLCRRPSTGE